MMALPDWPIAITTSGRRAIDAHSLQVKLVVFLLENRAACSRLLFQYFSVTVAAVAAGRAHHAILAS